MTQTFETILEIKKGAIMKVLEGLQDLAGQPQLAFPPDAELRKCSSAELVYLIALANQVQSLEEHVKNVQKNIFMAPECLSALKTTFLTLGKCDDSKGGASFGW